MITVDIIVTIIIIITIIVSTLAKSSLIVGGPMRLNVVEGTPAYGMIYVHKIIDV